MLSWKKSETLLRPIGVALAEPAAGSDRHLRLNDLIARATWIDRWIEEGQQTRLLVRTQTFPQRQRERAERDIRRDEPDGFPHVQAVPEDHRQQQQEEGAPELRR